MKERYSDKESAITWQSVKDIEFAWWNCNTIPPGSEEAKALEADMRSGGPYAIDPIKVASKRQITGDQKQPDVLVCLDGNHRLKYAIALGWPKIRCIADTSIRDEVTARVFSYQVNFERGHMDPFKEAENFRWMMEKNRFTQEELAQELHIDRTTVARRLSLLKIPEEVKREVTANTSMPKLSVSHLEAMAAASPAVQKEVVKDVINKGRRGQHEVTVSDIQEKVQYTTRIEEAAAKLRAALADPKTVQKTCPTCKQPPSEVHYNGLPWVRCQNYDSPWNLQTGKTAKQVAQELSLAERRNRVHTKGAKKGKFIPNYVLSTHTTEEWVACALNLFHAVIPRLASATSIRVYGESANPKADFEFEVHTDWATFIDIDVPGHKLYFRLEDKKYKVGSLKQFHTLIRPSGTIRTEKDQQEVERELEDFWRAWAPKEVLAAEAKDAKAKQDKAKQAAKDFVRNNAPKGR